MKSILDDDQSRRLVLNNVREDLPHLGVVGDTCTIVLSGEETADRYCPIDLHVPPGGAPPPVAVRTTPPPKLFDEQQAVS